MQYDDAAVIKSGIPRAHATVFQQVANECDTIIISRSVGKYELLSNVVYGDHAVAC